MYKFQINIFQFFNTAEKIYNVLVDCTFRNERFMKYAFLFGMLLYKAKQFHIHSINNEIKVIKLYRAIYV